MLIHDWLIETKASDIMVRKLVTARVDQSLAEIAGILLREQISGLPVLDSNESCVGVFAVSDVLRAEQQTDEERRELLTSDYFTSGLALPESVYREKLEEFRDQLVPAAEQPIKRYMTTDLVTVSTNSPLEKVIQAMVDAHLHRVLVTDEGGRLVGIVATIDVLAAFLRGGSRGEMSSEARHLQKEHHL